MGEDKPPLKDDSPMKRINLALWLIIGFFIGLVLFFTFVDNLGLAIILGMAFGVAIGLAIYEKKQKNE